MAYTGDQYQSIDATSPLDTDPESSIGDELRTLKAQVLGYSDAEHARTGKHLRFYDGTDTGTANTYKVQISQQIAALDAGLHIYFKPANTNTGASTLEFTANSVVLGTYDIKLADSAMTEGDLLVNRVVLLVFDGTNFELVNPPTATALSGSGSGDDGVFELLVNSEEGTYSEIVDTTAATSLGSLTLPTNSYSKVLIDAEVQLRNHTGSGRNYTVEIFEDTTLRRTAEATIKNTNNNAGLAVGLSIIIDGGQSSDTTITVKITMSSASTNVGATLDTLRIYGY